MKTKISQLALLLLLQPSAEAAPFDPDYVYHFMLGYGAKNLARMIDKANITTTCTDAETDYLKDAFKAITLKDMASPCYMNPDEVQVRDHYADIAKCQTSKGENNCETCQEKDAYPKCSVDFKLFYHSQQSDCNQCKPLCPNFPISQNQYNWQYVTQSGVGDALADAARKVHEVYKKCIYPSLESGEDDANKLQVLSWRDDAVSDGKSFAETAAVNTLADAVCPEVSVPLQIGEAAYGVYHAVHNLNSGADSGDGFQSAYDAGSGMKAAYSLGSAAADVAGSFVEVEMTPLEQRRRLQVLDVPMHRDLTVVQGRKAFEIAAEEFFKTLFADKGRINLQNCLEYSDQDKKLDDLLQKIFKAIETDQQDSYEQIIQQHIPAINELFLSVKDMKKCGLEEYYVNHIQQINSMLKNAEIKHAPKMYTINKRLHSQASLTINEHERDLGSVVHPLYAQYNQILKAQRDGQFGLRNSYYDVGKSLGMANHYFETIDDIGGTDWPYIVFTKIIPALTILVTIFILYKCRDKASNDKQIKQVQNAKSQSTVKSVQEV